MTKQLAAPGILAFNRKPDYQQRPGILLQSKPLLP